VIVCFIFCLTCRTYFFCLQCKDLSEEEDADADAEEDPQQEEPVTLLTVKEYLYGRVDDLPADINALSYEDLL